MYMISNSNLENKLRSEKFSFNCRSFYLILSYPLLGVLNNIGKHTYHMYMHTHIHIFTHIHICIPFLPSLNDSKLSILSIVLRMLF